MASYRISRMKQVKRLECGDIPDRNGKNVAHMAITLLYSAEYCRLQRLTTISYIPKEILEYPTKANVWVVRACDARPTVVPCADL